MPIPPITVDAWHWCWELRTMATTLRLNKCHYCSILAGAPIPMLLGTEAGWQWRVDLVKEIY